jgi:hypothetical protein
MKTKLFFLVLLIVCFSCGTNNKPLSDAQKEKIKGEVKEVVNTFIKGCEEANADMVMESFLDSPDFIDITNGMTFSYKEMMAMKPNFNAVLNQKCTIINEKFAFLDKSTVLYTAETKWSTNYKDGHSSITDPQAFLITFKKIDNKWRVIYLVDSNVEKDVPSESSKELNQVELMKQFLGTWKCDIAKDTTAFYEGKSYGTGLDCYFKFITKGNVVMEGKQLRGYDKNTDKFIFSGMMKGTDLNFFAGWFISKNKYIYVPYSDISNPEKASWKIEGEFKSPDMIFETSLINNKTAKTSTWTRLKQ